MNKLIVGGFTETVNDGSEIWNLADLLDSLDPGSPSLRRAWNELSPTDLNGAELILCYSWGVAATWNAISKLGLGAPILDHLILIAGVPCFEFNQWYGEVWHVPTLTKNAIAFNVDSFPISVGLKNPSASWINVNCDGPGMNHGSITKNSLITEYLKKIFPGQTGSKQRPKKKFPKEPRKQTSTRVGSPFRSSGSTSTARTTHPGLPLDGTNYVDRSSTPVFGRTLSVHDIHQGQVGDCYFLSTLAASALYKPENMRANIVPLGSNLIRCRFNRSSIDTWVYVDAELPDNVDEIWDDSTWVALYEKAYASYRTGADTYASLNSGFTGYAFSDQGYLSKTLYPSTSGLWQSIENALSTSWPVAVITPETIPSGIPLIPSHSHAITSVDLVGQTVTLYNPWGIDGAGTDSNPDDGTVVISFSDALKAIVSFSICTGFISPIEPPPGSDPDPDPDPAPVPVPAPTPLPIPVPAGSISISPTGPTTIPVAQFSSISGCQVETVNGLPDIGYVSSSGAFVEYTLVVPIAGTYTLTLAVSSPSTAFINLSLDKGILGALQIPSTGSWTTYKPAPFSLDLTVGTHVVRLEAIPGYTYNLRDSVITPNTLQADPIVEVNVVRQSGLITSVKV